MAGGTTVASKQHPYMKDYLIDELRLFERINRNPRPSKELMSEKEWGEFCLKRQQVKYVPYERQ